MLTGCTKSQRRMSSSSATLGTFPSTDLQHESATAVSSVLLLCDWSDDNPCEVLYASNFVVIQFNSLKFLHPMSANLI